MPKEDTTKLYALIRNVYVWKSKQKFLLLLLVHMGIGMQKKPNSYQMYTPMWLDLKKEDKCSGEKC